MDDAPICIKCGNTTFAPIEEDMNEESFKLIFLRCSACGQIAGLEDFYFMGLHLGRVGHSTQI